MLEEEKFSKVTILIYQILVNKKSLWIYMTIDNVAGGRLISRAFYMRLISDRIWHAVSHEVYLLGFEIIKKKM